ncbi:MAG: hypothetical protein AUH85_06860 [Chloroflexi bacterium 13_1_40CM_4_68_4]|nr:MAG: hypothetical protein AUH85_06860 [Chloroflexi bacterium 13_1_40CM_4_68_4]
MKLSALLSGDEAEIVAAAQKLDARASRPSAPISRERSKIRESRSRNDFAPAWPSRSSATRASPTSLS